MKLPLSWLKEYVDYNVTHEEFVERMMWRGFEVASVDSVMGEVENVVAGRIKTIAEHPDAQKLHVCTVDVGQGEDYTIVCGASNIFEGALVPVALPGAKLPGDICIQPTKMRGVLSNGMMCSGTEMGLTDSDYPGSEVHGLLMIKEDVPVGTPIAKALGLDDVVFDIELTPNRADCQSIIGMCREVAAALGQKFKEPEIKQVAGTGKAADYASVTVLDSELCPRYAARVVVDLKIEPSPVWMQKKLRSVGLRPINNIVDITNIVMVEYGHPMHAFDLACVADGHIVVRRAVENEVVTTLDSKQRPVTPEMLLIADPKKGVGIAGVMGGENSEITANTKATLFEAAVFKNSNIRATCRKLRHTTDAAAMFIKGVEPVNAMKALNRAIELVEQLHAGTVIGDTIDVCSANTAERVIDVDYAHVNKILNTDIAPESMVEMLGTINIEAKVAGDKLVVSVPHFRVDIESGIEADWDIAEEVGRIYGYYNIKPTLMQGDTFCGKLTEEFKDEDKLKDVMVALGAYEMYNYNFTGPNALNALLLAPDSEKRRAVKLLNPFGEDQSLMRTTLIPGILNVLCTNINRKSGHSRFFEVGNVHFDNDGKLPIEHKMLGLALIGENEDFFTLKGCVEYVLDAFGINNAKFSIGGGEYFANGKKALVSVDGECIGELGEIHPYVTKAFEIPVRAYIAEIDVAKLCAHKVVQKKYQALPKYPMVERDIAVIVDDKLQNADIKAAIENTKSDVIIENVQLFDVFRGVAVGAGKKSMAYSFTLRADDRTLTDEDITKAMDEIIAGLTAEYKAVLRGA